MRACAHCAGLTPSGDVCLHCDAPFPRRHRLVTVLLATTGSVLLAACYGPAGHYQPVEPEPGSAMQGSAAPAAAPGSATPAPAPTPHD